MAENDRRRRAHLWRQRYLGDQDRQAQVRIVDRTIGNGMELFGDVCDMRQIGERRGTSPGGIFIDPQSERTLYVKRYPDPLQASCEFISNRIYALAGVPVLRGYLVRDGDSYAYATDFQEDFTKLSRRERQQAKGIFAPAAYLADWDAVGTGQDNPFGNLQKDKANQMYLVDHGGSILFRGMNGRKRPEDVRADVVLELESMRGDINPLSKAIFGDMRLPEIGAQVRTLVEAIKDDQILTDIVEQSVIENSRAKQYITDFLLGRRNWLATEWRVDIGQHEAEVAIPDVQTLYRSHLDGAPGHGTFDEYIATYFPTASHQFKAKLANEIGRFFTNDQRIYEGSIRLDKIAYNELSRYPNLRSKGREYLLAQLGSERHLVRRDALEELDQILEAGEIPFFYGHYHSTTFAISDTLLEHKALLSAQEQRKRHIEPKSGEAFTDTSVIPIYGRLYSILVGSVSVPGQYMKPRWFNLEERGLGFAFHREGLRKHLPKPYRDYIGEAGGLPDSTFGLEIGPEVPINNETVALVNYDIEAKHLALRLQQGLGLNDAALYSLQATDLFQKIRYNERLQDQEAIRDYVKGLLAQAPSSTGDQGDTFELIRVTKGIFQRGLA